MGQQQLLIIILGVIVVGLAVYAVLGLFGTYHASHERDVIIQRMNILVGEAKKYAAKPATLGGGDGSYLGFAPPTKLSVTSDFHIFTTAGDNWVLFQGFGTTTGEDGRTPVEVIGQFDKTTDSWSSLTTVN